MRMGRERDKEKERNKERERNKQLYKKREWGSGSKVKKIRVSIVSTWIVLIAQVSLAVLCPTRVLPD